MKYLLIAGLIITLAISGCVNTNNQANSVPAFQKTCREQCLEAAHQDCTGTWNISGTYPDCLCSYECGSGQPNQNETNRTAVQASVNQTLEKANTNNANSTLATTVETGNQLPTDTRSLSDIITANEATMKTQFVHNYGDGTFGETFSNTIIADASQVDPTQISFSDPTYYMPLFDGKTIPAIRAFGLWTFLRLPQATFITAYGNMIAAANTTKIDQDQQTGAGFRIRYNGEDYENCHLTSEQKFIGSAGAIKTNYFFTCDNMTSIQ